MSDSYIEMQSSKVIELASQLISNIQAQRTQEVKHIYDDARRELTKTETWWRKAYTPTQEEVNAFVESESGLGRGLDVGIYYTAMEVANAYGRSPELRLRKLMNAAQLAKTIMVSVDDVYLLIRN